MNAPTRKASLTNKEIMGIELSRIVDRIFHKAWVLQIGWVDLAEKAGVGVTTVYNLGEFTTMYPRFQTVARLARAVGMQLELSDHIAAARKKAQ